MTTRSMIRIRPGAGYIAILAILAILNILVLAAGCSADRKTARGDGSNLQSLSIVKQERRSRSSTLSDAADGRCEASAGATRCLASYGWSLSHN
ncbi:MAG TPA: hypothetical protein VF105_01185 [Gemmatimonadaceae bacterium]